MVLPAHAEFNLVLGIYTTTSRLKCSHFDLLFESPADYRSRASGWFAHPIVKGSALIFHQYLAGHLYPSGMTMEEKSLAKFSKRSSDTHSEKNHSKAVFTRMASKCARVVCCFSLPLLSHRPSSLSPPPLFLATSPLSHHLPSFSPPIFTLLTVLNTKVLNTLVFDYVFVGPTKSSEQGRLYSFSPISTVREEMDLQSSSLLEHGLF